MVDSFKFARLAFVALGLFGFTQVSFAQDASKIKAAVPSKVEKFGNWTVVCPPVGDKSGARCAAQLVLVDSKRKIILLSLRIGYNKEKLLVMDLVSPTEVFISPGAQIVLAGGAPLKLPYVSCGVQGCLSRLQVDDVTLSRLRGSSEAIVAIAGSNRKVLQLKLNIAGLNEAMNAISKG